jgi:hypothetical protein
MTEHLLTFKTRQNSCPRLSHMRLLAPLLIVVLLAVLLFLCGLLNERSLPDSMVCMVTYMHWSFQMCTHRVARRQPGDVKCP